MPDAGYRILLAKKPAAETEPRLHPCPFCAGTGQCVHCDGLGHRWMLAAHWYQRPRRTNCTQTITPEGRGYARFHFALVTSSLLFVLLFLVRVNHKGIQHLPRRLLDRQEWKQYASSGALGPDALLLVGLITLIWAVDWDAVRGYRVQIGAVSAIVVVRLLVLIVKRRKTSRVVARQR